MIAFLTNLAEHVGDEARFVHQGMTSSDVLDTCLAVQLSQAADILIADINALLAALKKRAVETKIRFVLAEAMPFMPNQQHLVSNLQVITLSLNAILIV